MCGGTEGTRHRTYAEAGLSPRVRGNRVLSGSFWGGVGSIPACAGEPLARMDDGALLGVYPRVCGGTAIRATSRPTSSGLSPRVRGNL